MRLRLITLIAALSLAACAPQQQTIDISRYFSVTEVAPFNVRGRGTITGQGFLRQSGGGVVTCAGDVVYLAPDTPFTRRFFAIIAEGNLPILANGRPSQLYPNAFRISECDAQGNFRFSDLAPGKWVVVTSVYWLVGNRQQGDLLLGDTEIIGDETAQVLLSDRNRI